jgi:hypothetical protein
MDPVQTLWNIIGHKQQEEAFKFQIAKEAYAIEMKEYEMFKENLSSSMELVRSATSKAEKDHYLSVAESYFKQIPKKQQERLWPLLANSPLDPQVQKYEAAKEGLAATGHLLPGQFAKKYENTPEDEINPMVVAHDAFDEADSQYKLDKVMGFEAEPELAIPTSLTQEIDTANGKKKERLWAIREGQGKHPRLVSETEMNWADIEKQRGLEAGHIANHNGNIVTEEPAYINGIYGIVRTKTSAVPGTDMKPVPQFVPDPKYSDEYRAEQRAIRSESRGEQRAIRSESRQQGYQIAQEQRVVQRKETEEITNFTSYLNLATRGNIDMDELDKTKEGRAAKYVIQSRKEKGFFGDYPPLQNRYIAEQLEQSLWPNSTIIFEPQGEYDWHFTPNPLKLFGASTWINKDHYFPMSGENVRVIQNSKTIQIPTHNPDFNAEIIIDYTPEIEQGKPPLFRSRKDGRYFPPELQNENAPPGERLNKIMEYYKNPEKFKVSDEDVRNWRYVNPPKLINWGAMKDTLQKYSSPYPIGQIERIVHEYNNTTDEKKRIELLQKLDKATDKYKRGSPVRKKIGQ